MRLCGELCCTTHAVSADIEASHRDTRIWGSNALVFQPGRWTNRETAEFENANFVPFGAKPFACPAKRVPKIGAELPFGVSMIALLVGALTKEIEEKWKLEGELPEYGTPLETERHSYSDLKLVRSPVQEELVKEELMKEKMAKEELVKEELVLEGSVREELAKEERSPDV